MANLSSEKIFLEFGKLRMEINDALYQDKMVMGAYELDVDNDIYVTDVDNLLKCLNKLEKSLIIIIGGMQ